MWDQKLPLAALELPSATCGSLSDNLWIRSPIFSISSHKFQIYLNGEPSKLLKILMTKKQVDNKYGKWENREQLVYFKEKH